MKKFLLSTILLLSSIYNIIACGYSPYGEDIRYFLTDPTAFEYDGYNAFTYSTRGLYYKNIPSKKISANILDWHKFTKKKVEVSEIQKFMNEVNDFDKTSDNQFVQFLYAEQNTSALNYLQSAKKYESLNTWYSESQWEKDETLKPLQLKAIQELNQLLEKEENPVFKRKYAFLCIRLAFYAGEKEIFIQSLFNEYYKNGEKDYLYYWSLYFHSFTDKTNTYMVDVANILSNSPDKAYATYHYFKHKWNKEKALQQTSNVESIANIYAYETIQNTSPSLNQLQLIYNNTPNHPTLSFLILRELNKLEDWIFTPYYTNYSPSLKSQNFNEKILLERSEEDRLYAQKVLDFVQTIDLEKVENSMVWKYAELELLFMTRNFETCLEKITLFENNYPQEKCIQQVEQIKALCLVSNQEKGKTVITPTLEKLIFKYQKQYHFIFSLGREFEFQGNLLDGIGLITTINHNKGGYGDPSYAYLAWRGSLLSTPNMQYFLEYFEYINYAYSTEKLEQLLNDIKSITLTSDIEKLLYTSLKKDENYLGDLLGTKYIRENKLKKALTAFESVGEKYWEENYNAWERDKYDEHYQFKQNPFYELEYTFEFIEKRDSFIVTKPNLTKQLIHYLELAENPTTEDQDYYYFLVANCYFNMTTSGNAWMMRRYWNSVRPTSSHIDNDEFTSRLLAQKYYQRAYETAKTDEFRALCLRMVDYAEKQTIYSPKVKKQYPQYFEELSQCYYFQNFFKARRKKSL